MGLKFISYAVWWIKAFIVRAIDENGNLIRIPSNQHLRIRKALRENGPGGKLDDDVRSLMKMGESGIGIDSQVPGEERTWAERLADEILAGAPERVREVKKLFRAPDRALARRAADGLLRHWESWNEPAAAEGIAAFLEKRDPRW